MDCSENDVLRVTSVVTSSSAGCYLLLDPIQATALRLAVSAAGVAPCPFEELTPRTRQTPRTPHSATWMTREYASDVSIAPSASPACLIDSARRFIIGCQLQFNHPDEFFTGQTDDRDPRPRRVG
jgi:hypothetical protein